MSQKDLFDRILASLHEATLDDSHWPATAGLIDDACRVKGNVLAFAEGASRNDTQVFLANFCARGHRRRDVEREYFDVYYPHDERVPRLRGLADCQLVRCAQLYTDREKKTSPAYNEMLRRAASQDGLSARMNGPGGSHIVWTVTDPIDSGGWQSAQIDMIKRLLPHLRRYVRVRQALFDARALRTSLTCLLGNRRCGVIQLDWRGRIVEANDLARDCLRERDGLFDQGGYLRARRPLDHANLQKMLKRSLPRLGCPGVSGSVTIGRISVEAPLVAHALPVGERHWEFSAPRVAVLVLVADPQGKAHIDPGVVAIALGITPAESRVAVRLATGESVRDIAMKTGRKESTIRGHVKHIQHKTGICRQTELVRRVLALAGLRL